MDKTKQKIAHITMVSQILVNRLHDEVAENNFSKGLKYSAKQFISQLEVVERKRFDKMFVHDEKASNIIYSGIDRFYEKVAAVDIEYMDSASNLFDLLMTNPVELEKAINLVLNEKL